MKIKQIHPRKKNEYFKDRKLYKVINEKEKF